MAGLAVDLEGAAALASTAAAGAAQLAAGDDQVNQAAADEVLGYVQPPVRTGYLASTIGADVDALGFTLYASARYAPIVHAHDPFLTGPLTERQEAVVDIYSDYLGQVVDTLQGA